MAGVHTVFRAQRKVHLSSNSSSRSQKQTEQGFQKCYFFMAAYNNRILEACQFSSAPFIQKEPRQRSFSFLCLLFPRIGLSCLNCSCIPSSKLHITIHTYISNNKKICHILDNHESLQELLTSSLSHFSKIGMFK